MGQKRKIYLSLCFGDTVMNLKFMKKCSLNENSPPSKQLPRWVDMWNYLFAILQSKTKIAQKLQIWLLFVFHIFFVFASYFYCATTPLIQIDTSNIFFRDQKHSLRNPKKEKENIRKKLFRDQKNSLIYVRFFF